MPDIKLSVPKELLFRSGLAGMEGFMVKVLLLELCRRERASKKSVAKILDMSAEELETAIEEMKLPEVVYKKSASDKSIVSSSGADFAGVGKVLTILVVILLAAAIAVGAFMALRGGKTSAYLDQARSAISDPGETVENAATAEKFMEEARVAGEAGDMVAAREAYSLALGYLQKASESDRDNPTFLYDIGYVYEMLGMYREAEDYYRRTLALDPGYSSARVRLGNLESIRGRK